MENNFIHNSRIFEAYVNLIIKNPRVLTVAAAAAAKQIKNPRPAT